MTFSFRNRFEINDGRRIGIEAEEYALTEANSSEKIWLASGTRSQQISECQDVVLMGEGYPDFESAAFAGRRWRQIVSSYLARLAYACNFGDHQDSRLVPDEGTVADGSFYAEKLGIDVGKRVLIDRLGLLVFTTEPVHRVVHWKMGRPTVVTFSADAVERIAEIDKRNKTLWSPELELAYKLVHGSLSDENPESQFVLAVTAIEALIPYREKEPELSRMLDELARISDGLAAFDEGTRGTVINVLKNGQMNSVRQFGLKLADRLSGTYGELAPRKYFDDVYKTRSDLAHGNLRDLPNLQEDALKQRYSELLRFVLDILESWTERPGFDTDDAATI